ncbi:hypothetical protein ACHAP7_009451 [Fusarium lateritium]
MCNDASKRKKPKQLNKTCRAVENVTGKHSSSSESEDKRLKRLDFNVSSAWKASLRE